MKGKLRGKILLAVVMFVLSIVMSALIASLLTTVGFALVFTVQHILGTIPLVALAVFGVIFLFLFFYLMKGMVKRLRA